MDTDEYEFSLLRELDVCRAHIDVLERSLVRLAQRARGSADAARSALEREAAPAPDADRRSQLDALERWRARAAEYEALLRSARRKV